MAKKMILISILAVGAIYPENIPLPIQSVNNEYAIDFNNDNQVLNLIHILELYPLLLNRIDFLETQEKEYIDSIIDTQTIAEDSIRLAEKEQRKQRLSKAVIIALGILLPLAFGLGIYAGLKIPTK